MFCFRMVRHHWIRTGIVVKGSENYRGGDDHCVAIHVVGKHEGGGQVFLCVRGSVPRPEMKIRAGGDR